MTPAEYRKLRASRKGITPQARVIYRAAFNGETMPKGWSVSFVGKCKVGRKSGYLGVCRYRNREIEILWPSLTSENWLATLIHEFIHLRCHKLDWRLGYVGLRHGAEFNRLVAAAYARVWEK